jgi:hypothetical protein
MNDPQVHLTATLSRFEDAYFELIGKEEELKIAKEQFKMIAENDLPEAMDAADVDTATTPSLGITVIVEPEVHVNVTKKDMPEACDWFMANGHGDIVKRDFTMSFGAKEYERANQFYHDLRLMIKDRGYEVPIQIDKTVHGKTLKAYVTKLLRAGKLSDLPSYIAVFVPRLAKIVMEKEG